MSTLGVNTLTNAAGGDASTPLQISQGRAKAWFNLNGTGTIAERDSFNVSSYTDNGTGDYSATFTTAMLNTNFSMLAALQAVSASFTLILVFTSTGQNVANPTTTTSRCLCATINVGVSDNASISASIMGDQ